MSAQSRKTQIISTKRLPNSPFVNQVPIIVCALAGTYDISTENRMAVKYNSFGSSTLICAKAFSRQEERNRIPYFCTSRPRSDNKNICFQPILGHRCRIISLATKFIRFNIGPNQDNGKKSKATVNRMSSHSRGTVWW